MKSLLLSLILCLTINAYSQDLNLADLESKYEQINLSQERLSAKVKGASIHLENSATLRQQAFKQRIIGGGLLLVGSLIQINSAANIPYPTTFTIVTPYAFYAAGFGFSISALLKDRDSNNELKNAGTKLRGL